jgi:hypothetical protein
MKREKEIVSVSQKNKIFIVDDHPIVRKGLAQLINHAHHLVAGDDWEPGRLEFSVHFVQIRMADTAG